MNEQQQKIKDNSPQNNTQKNLILNKMGLTKKHGNMVHSLSPEVYAVSAPSVVLSCSWNMIINNSSCILGGFIEMTTR